VIQIQRAEQFTNAAARLNSELDHTVTAAGCGSRIRACCARRTLNLFLSALPATLNWPTKARMNYRGGRAVRIQPSAKRNRRSHR
jgi:hypothetical protein